MLLRLQYITEISQESSTITVVDSQLSHGDTACLKSLRLAEIRSSVVAVPSMWSDITELCRGAAKELTHKNPMINIDGFSLHDAMSAVEV